MGGSVFCRDRADGQSGAEFVLALPVKVRAVVEHDGAPDDGPAYNVRGRAGGAAFGEEGSGGSGKRGAHAAPASGGWLEADRGGWHTDHNPSGRAGGDTSQPGASGDAGDLADSGGPERQLSVQSTGRRGPVAHVSGKKLRLPDTAGHLQVSGESYALPCPDVPTPDSATAAMNATAMHSSGWVAEARHAKAAGGRGLSKLSPEDRATRGLDPPLRSEGQQEATPHALGSAGASSADATKAETPSRHTSRKAWPGLSAELDASGNAVGAARDPTAAPAPAPAGGGPSGQARAAHDDPSESAKSDGVASAADVDETQHPGCAIGGRSASLRDRGSADNGGAGAGRPARPVSSAAGDVADRQSRAESALSGRLGGEASVTRSPRREAHSVRAGTAPVGGGSASASRDAAVSSMGGRTVSGRASIPSGAGGAGVAASGGHRWGFGRDRALSSGSVHADTSGADLIGEERALLADPDGSATQKSPAAAAEHTQAASPAASVASVSGSALGSAAAVSPPPGSARHGRDRPSPRKDRAGGRRARRRAEREAGADSGPSDASPGEPLRMHVLVVEDDTATARILVRLLVKLGFAVECAGDGQQGLARMGALVEEAEAGRAGALVAVLTDSSMPVMSGPQMAVAAAADPRLKSVPLVGLSGAPEDIGPTSQFARCGAVATLLKPVSRFKILSALRECVCKGGHPVPPALDVAIASARASFSGDG